MSKLKILGIIVLASIIALAIQVLFGNFLSAKLATLPGLRNLDLFNPRAPIVVTNKETVRVSDSSDAVETTNAVKSKLATVVYYDGKAPNNKLVISGGAINWTSDGYFISTATALSVTNKTYAVVLNNGDIFPVNTVFSDTASDLVILKTDAKGLATIEPMNVTELRPGEKMLMILNSLAANKTTFLESYVEKFANDVAGVEFDSNKVGRSIVVQNVSTLLPGHAAINLDGRLAGLWDGSQVISVDAIRVFASNFFGNNQQILRPAFGFTYKQLAASEARALQLQTGGQVIDVTATSPAVVGGLKPGDIITAVNGQKIDDDSLLETSLATLVPGEVATLQVYRGDGPITVLITPKILE